MGKYTAVESLLIEQVQQHPALWKNTDPEYKNRSAKEKSWISVAENVNLTASTNYSVVEFRDKVWKNLRDAYVRILSGNIKKKASGSDRMHKYPYLEAMSFLKMYINTRSSTPGQHSSAKTNPINRDIKADKDPPLHVEIDVNDLQSTDNNEVAKKQDETQIITSKQAPKRPYARISQKAVDKALDCKILDYLSGRGSEIDSDTIFGQSVAAQLRQLDKRMNALARVKIQQLLLDLQFPENTQTDQTMPN